MAITTIDGVVAGNQPAQSFLKVTGTLVAAKTNSLWGVAGLPPAGTYNTTLNGGTYSSTSAIVQGQIPHFDPAGGLAYLSRFTATVIGTNGMIHLCDRLWDNGGITITSTSLQSITSPTWPTRDNIGHLQGHGVLIAVEVSAATASTATLTLGYTSADGTSGRTTTITNTGYTGTVQGSFGIFPLVAGDTGVSSVQSIQLAASMTSGTINLVAFRVITLIDGMGVSTLGSRAVDAIKCGFANIWNGTVPFILYSPNTTSGVTISGTYQETQG